MNAPARLLATVLVVLPVLAWPEDQPVTATQPATAEADTPQREKDQLIFDLNAAIVQSAIRTAAANDTAPPQEPVSSEAAADEGEALSLTFRAPRRAHHMTCDAINCVAYTADGDTLYTIPRDEPHRDEWLSCQSSNDLLTTFERYDKCRGVNVGLPSQAGEVLLDPPSSRL
jgi:hypothetical protein